MASESKEELTKRVALQLQVALTAWNELYPDDTDEDACRKSLDLVEFEVEDLLTRPDPPPPEAQPAQEQAPVSGPSDQEPTQVGSELDAQEKWDQELADLPPRGVFPRQRGPLPFRQMLIEIGREFPGGLDITTIIEEAQARGWSHPNARNYVSITSSQLVKAGLLVRRERGTYALSPAFMGGGEEDDAPEP